MLALIGCVIMITYLQEVKVKILDIIVHYRCCRAIVSTFEESCCMPLVKTDFTRVFLDLGEDNINPRVDKCATLVFFCFRNT